VPPLLAIMDDRSEPDDVRACAVSAIVAIQARQAAPALSRLAKAKGDAGRLRQCAASELVDVTSGAVDDVEIVKVVASRGTDHDHLEYDYALEHIAQNGQTRAVRAAARRALGTNKILGIDESFFFLLLSIVYYTPAAGFWLFRYRNFLRRKQSTLGSLFLLTTLIAVGLPLAVAAWNAW
jgi:hypothetical protein